MYLKMIVAAICAAAFCVDLPSNIPDTVVGGLPECNAHYLSPTGKCLTSSACQEFATNVAITAPYITIRVEHDNEAYCISKGCTGINWEYGFPYCITPP